MTKDKPFYFRLDRRICQQKTKQVIDEYTVSEATETRKSLNEVQSKLHEPKSSRIV